MAVIPLKDVLQTMEQIDARGRHVPFSLTYISANRTEWKKWKRYDARMKSFEPYTQHWESARQLRDACEIGGRIINVESGILAGTRGLFLGTATPSTMVEKTKRTMQKKPNHWLNKTRNVKVPLTGEIRKVHIRLITQFNNTEVIY